LQQTGVYLLRGPREDGEGDRLYIGEGDPIKPRSASHHSGSAQKVFWSRAMCFVSMGHALNKAYVLAMLPVVGRSANGRVDWKDPQGRALKALQNMNSFVYCFLLQYSISSLLKNYHHGKSKGHFRVQWRPCSWRQSQDRYGAAVSIGKSQGFGKRCSATSVVDKKVCKRCQELGLERG
jgi:hypothetical protein